MIHPHHHANHDPRMNCHGLYEKYNISLSGYLLRMHFVRKVLQERKCDIAPVTLNGKIVALSTKSDRHQYHQTDTVCALYEDRHANFTQILQHSNYPSESYSSVIFSTRSYSDLLNLRNLEFLKYEFSCCQA